MNEVSMNELRQNAKAVIARVQCGEELVLTYRGKSAVRLVPLKATKNEVVHTGVITDDPLLKLAGAATSAEGFRDSNKSSL